MTKRAIATKVYVLFNGCYSDTHVVGIYTSQANAQVAARLFTDDADIQEFTLDSHVDLMLSGAVPYFVRLNRTSGDVENCSESTSTWGVFSSDVGEDIHKNLYTHVWAVSREEAIKIAGDRRRMFLAKVDGEAIA